jgi:hypothetical protein
MTQLSREAAGIRFWSAGIVPVVEVVGDLDLSDLHAFEDFLQRAFVPRRRTSSSPWRRRTTSTAAGFAS